MGHEEPDSCLIIPGCSRNCDWTCDEALWIYTLYVNQCWLV